MQAVMLVAQTARLGIHNGRTERPEGTSTQTDSGGKSDICFDWVPLLAEAGRYIHVRYA